MERIVNPKDKKLKIILLVCNFILILATVVAAGLYSRHIRREQEETNTTEFIRTVESMKQVSQNYLDSERGYVRNWAAYISGQDMTMEEALDFLRSINTNKERFAHIVDMDSFMAYSSYFEKGKEEIDDYVKYKDQNVEAELPFADIMRKMFNGTGEEFEVLGKYRVPETKANALGIGARVSLHTDSGTKDYLLLRIIPIEEIRRSWVFPMEYTSAEVGIITSYGDYVIQSPSMKSTNFREYIRGYNFQDNYNQVDALREQLETTSSGMLEFKNFRGKDCLWYYSSFGEDSALDILGVINKDELKSSISAWYIAFLVCGVIVVLVLIDGMYLVSMNRKLRIAAELSQQASHAKTQFLSAMSHDIRTPLNAVMGMMEIAQKNADRPEYVKECMDKGLHSGRQLLTLINDVLDISKIESGKVTLNPERVDLKEVVHDLTEMQAQAIAKKNITLECDFDRLPHRYVCADRMRLSQIYVNLFTNAVKYTEEGGRITLRLYEKPVADAADKTRLVFYVEDTGIGMTEEFQKRMYSSFSREVKTQVNSTQGTGLGLAIVKQMVDLMDGTIACKSTPGKGTTFKVSVNLPIMEGGKEDHSEELAPQSIENMHLLIAEDNELNWEIANELLSEYGIRCDHAENGKECIEMLTNAPADTYSVILMDVHMPIMNGYEATKAIRALEDESRSHIPIIAMTADAFAEDVQKCLKCGMNGHVAKPIDMGKLMTYLGKIRNGQL